MRREQKDTLCKSCANCLVVESRYGISSYCTFGGSHPLQVPPQVSKCNQYDEKNQLTKYDLERIAWVIRHDKSGRIAGFIPPKTDEKKW